MTRPKKSQHNREQCDHCVRMQATVCNSRAAQTVFSRQQEFDVKSFQVRTKNKYKQLKLHSNLLNKNIISIPAAANSF